ncbi:hypothetical protein [Massilia aquatica]|uniref:Uncharacterized protein n=1 Tax=Massilia aquatica TaxID=2609000 RepID=A0ABX0MLE4_9BURK|nr:hypothetical protein [Massilia aquatica]NHZ44611.1 hypothetical protein [Massilia aquatica]
MPYIALNECDVEVTSFQCLDEFKREGTEYQSFRCAFCEVPYIAKAIYNETSVAKAPHFAVARGRSHIGDCNGEVLLVVAPVEGGGIGAKVVKREHEVPEVLVVKPPTRSVVSGPKGGPATPLSEAEIKRRRMNAGKKYGVSRFTSSLLASFIEAKAHLVSAAFAKAKEQGLTGAKEKAFLNSYLEKYPLQLFEQKLNYSTAFWRANYVRAGQAPRIFQATNGNVMISAQNLTINSAFLQRSTAKSPSTVEATATALETNGKKITVGATAVVLFDLSGVDRAELPRAHKSLLKKLAETQAADRTVSWSAYGVMTVRDGLNCIELLSLDHLHIKT